MTLPFDDAIAIPNHAAELEHQQMVKQCHCLIAKIANRPGGTKLLQGIIPTLELYAGYKANRRR